MPVITLYRHGFTAGCAPSSAPPPPVRTECAGWTIGAIRRNKLFLYSVDETRLTGIGYALSLTVKVCPPTHEDWKQVINAFFFRLRRLEMIRAHWVVEWQRRGFPHLHMAVWFPAETVNAWVEGGFARLLVSHWLQVAGPLYGSLERAQHVTPIYDALGWNKYTSKHASRGLSNYQRNPASIPAGWREHGTGRMWGKLGDWSGVCQEAVRLEMPLKAYHLLRRITRGYNKAKARTSLAAAVDPCYGARLRHWCESQHRDKLAQVRPHADPHVSAFMSALFEEWKAQGPAYYFSSFISSNSHSEDRAAALKVRQALRRVTFTRRMLGCSDPKLSAVRGLNEWMPISVQRDALAYFQTITEFQGEQKAVIAFQEALSKKTAAKEKLKVEKTEHAHLHQAWSQQITRFCDEEGNPIEATAVEA
jgi:hypothetical protein